MSATTWFQKDYKLPPVSAKEIGWLCALIIFPNVLFWLAAWYTNTSRPVINIDYLIAVLFWLLPFRLFRFLGGILLLIAALFDAFMLIVQLFPFMDLAAIQYFLPFISIAPKPFQIAIAIFTVYIITLPFSTAYFIRKQNVFWAFSICSLLILFGLVVKDDIKYGRFDGIMARDNYYLIHTQAQLYHDLTQEGFVVESGWTPKLKPILPDQQFATAKFNQPRSDKMVLIVAESWGMARTEQMQNDILAKILQQKDKLDFIEKGYIDFEGATVQGELRELCQLNVRGFALSRSPDSEFAHCLPNQLKQAGYHTIAVHGTSGKLYDRDSWYVKAGFQEMVFGENLLGMRRCAAFSGVCDTEIAREVIPEKFKNKQNLFLYWLTLTSHQPYEKNDIHNTRFNCNQYGMKSTGDICRNAQLETQFFDDVATWLNKPEMKGVEVVIVGDHMPPILDGETIHPYLRWNTIGWVHFKIK